MEPDHPPVPFEPAGYRPPLGAWQAPVSTVVCEAAREPATQSSGQRVGPPSLPPATPGTAGASPGDGGTWDNPLTVDSVGGVLAPSLSTAPLLASYLEGFLCYGDDPAVKDKLFERAAELREAMRHPIVVLQLLVWHESSRWGRTDFRRWRLELLRMAKRGASRTDLDRHFVLRIFQDTEAEAPAEQVRQPVNLYRYPTRDPLTARLGLVPPGEALQRFIDDLRLEIDDPRNYVDAATFRTKVYLKLLAFVYAADLATARTADVQPLAPLKLDPKPAQPTREETEALCKRLLGEAS